MSSSESIKKIQEAENKAAQIRQSALDDSRLFIRNAEGETSKLKEKKLKEARANARQTQIETQRLAKGECDIVRKLEANKNDKLKKEVQKKIGSAVDFIIKSVREGIN